MNSLEKNFFTISFSIFPILLIVGTFLSNFYLTLISVYFFYFCIKKNYMVWKKNYLVYFFSTLYVYLLVNSILADDILLSIKRTFPYIRFLIFWTILSLLVFCLILCFVWHRRPVGCSMHLGFRCATGGLRLQLWGLLGLAALLPLLLAPVQLLHVHLPLLHMPTVLCCA